MSNGNLFSSLNDRALSFSDDRGTVNVLYESTQTVLKRSISKKGVFRGLHRQAAPALQTKIIRVISGKIIDFIARPEDPDEVIWYSEITSKDEWVLIDSCFAHGFYSVEDVEFEYICEGRYDDSLETTYRVDDIVKQELGISHMILSEKDLAGKRFGKSVRAHGNVLK